MTRSQVIDIGGCFMGAAITLANGGFRFFAVDQRLACLMGRRWHSLAALRRSVRITLADLVSPALAVA